MTLYFDESGTPNAPTIVFLHGVGAGGWMWWRQITALSDFHCLNVDLPGHAKSNHISWVSLTDTAHQVARLIQSHATDGHANLVGLSLGAYVALILLENYEALVQRAILSGVTASPMTNRFLLRPQLWMMSLMKTRWVANMQAKALNLPPNMQSEFTDNLAAMSMQTYRTIMEEAVDFHMSAALENVATPTLVTAGGKESEIILQAVDVISEMMPNAEGRFAPGLKHGWNVEAPDLFSGMIRAWISGTPLPKNLQTTLS